MATVFPPSREAVYSPWNGLQGGKKVQLDKESMQSTRSGQKMNNYN